VRGVRLREGDAVVDMAVLDPMATLLTVCQNGYGKRTSYQEYRLQSRGGSGIINIRTSERNGKVVAMKSMRDADELMLITDGGMIVRTGVSELRTIGRATQGVRLMALKPGHHLVAVARVVAEDNSQTQLPFQPAEGEDATSQTPAQPLPELLPADMPEDDSAEAPADEPEGDEEQA
jgi:DNA gyrase subunit A